MIFSLAWTLNKQSGLLYIVESHFCFIYSVRNFPRGRRAFSDKFSCVTVL